MKNRFWNWSPRKLRLSILYSNPKFYGPKTYLCCVEVGQVVKPSKNWLKWEKNVLLLLRSFFQQISFLLKSSHIPFDSAWLTLQNRIYDISVWSQYRVKKIKILCVTYFRRLVIFQYFNQMYRSENGFQKKLFISL